MSEVLIWLDTWYDRHVRSWCIQAKDERGDQIDSTYVYSKPEAKDIEKTWIEYYKIDPVYNRKKQQEHKKYLKALSN